MSAENEIEKASDTQDHDRKPATYKVIIDKVELTLRNPTPTGAELLTAANKIPVEKFAIYLKGKESQPQRIGLTQTVDLREPGVEKFVTLPLDQTEG